MCTLMMERGGRYFCNLPCISYFFELILSLKSYFFYDIANILYDTCITLNYTTRDNFQIAFIGFKQIASTVFHIILIWYFNNTIP